MICQSQISERARFNWAVLATLVFLIAMFGGCSQSASAQGVLYVIDGRTDQHVNPYNPALQAAPAGMEWVENCIDSGHYADNPNYRDPARTVSGIASALFKSTGVAEAAKAGPVASGAAVQVAGTVRSTDTVSRYVWVESKDCTYTARAIPPPPARATRPSVHVEQLTREEALKIFSEHPEIPQPIGGGLYVVRWYDGTMYTGTLEQIGYASQAHYNLCFALQNNRSAYLANHCDK